MNKKNTDDLIRSLSAGLSPVRTLRPPACRSLGWLGLVTLLFMAAIVLKGNVGSFAARIAEPRMAIQCAATLMTGITAIVAAFYLSLPDRSRVWRYAPLAPLAIWLDTSGLGCMKYGIGLGEPGHRLGLSPHCFIFIVGVSVPLAVWLFAVLRRTRPLEPLPVALTASLGAAALAAFLLQFFHPFDTTWIDLGVHLIAVSVVVGVATISRRVLPNAGGGRCAP